MMIRETRLNRRKNEELSKEYDLLKKRTTREKEELLMNVERSLDQIDSLKAENRKNSLRREGKCVYLHACVFANILLCMKVVENPYIFKMVKSYFLKFFFTSCFRYD